MTTTTPTQPDTAAARKLARELREYITRIGEHSEPSEIYERTIEAIQWTRNHVGEIAITLEALADDNERLREIAARWEPKNEMGNGGITTSDIVMVWDCPNCGRRSLLTAETMGRPCLCGKTPPPRAQS